MGIDILSYYSDFYICLLSFLHNIYLRGFDLFWSLCEDQNLVYSSICGIKPEIKTSCILPYGVQNPRSKPRVSFHMWYNIWDQNLVYPSICGIKPEIKTSCILPSRVQCLRSKPRVFFHLGYNAWDQNLVYSSVWSTIPEIKTSYILPPEIHYQDQNLAHDQTVLEKCISIIKKFTSNLTVSPYFP